MTGNIVAAEELDPGAVRRLIEDAFAGGRGQEWWEWKHRDGPWGASTGVAFVEGGRILSVRLLLPWRLRFNGRAVGVDRAVDAATVSEAQGRGLFSVLNAELMEARRSLDRWTALFSTPNANSRGAYRRLGWTWLEPVAHRWGVVGPVGRRATYSEADPATVPPSPGPFDRISTDWSAEAWVWRVDPRCGLSYEAAVSSDAALVYRRIVQSGLPLLLVLHSDGELQARRALLRGVAARRRAVGAVEPAPPGASGPAARVGFRRGQSLLAVWANRDPEDPEALPIVDREAWWCHLADLERVL